MNFAKLLILLVLAWLLAPARLPGQAEDPVQIPNSLSGISVSQAYEVEDGKPLDLENDVLIRLLYRVAKISRKNFFEFSKFTTGLSLADVLENSRKYRFWVFNLRGRVTGVEVHKFLDSNPDSGLKGCYVVAMELPGGQPIIVVARAVPTAWLGDSDLDQPAGFQGFYFGTVASGATTDDDSGPAQALFLADRIGWFPDSFDEAMGTGAAQVLLARHGVDIGLVEQVKKQNTLPMSAADTESFFQMLNAARGISARDAPPASADFVELMQNPASHFANSVSVQGRVRRCVSIEIEDKDLATRMGFDRYYELDLLIPLGDRLVVVKNGPDQTLEYRHRFPVTVCMANLGPGMTVDELQNQVVEVRGFFYRFWKYKSEFTDQGDGSGGQVSPLIIGLTPLVMTAAQGIDRLLTYSVLGLLVAGVVFFWFMRPDKRKRAGSHTSTVNQPLPDRPDFSQIGREVD